MTREVAGYTAGEALLCFLRSSLRADSATRRLYHAITHYPIPPPRSFQSHISSLTHDPNSRLQCSLCYPIAKTPSVLSAFTLLAPLSRQISPSCIYFAGFCTPLQLERFLLPLNSPFPTELIHHILCRVLHLPTIVSPGFLPFVVLTR